MQAYSYDIITGEYEGTVQCQKDLRKPGVYLLPAHAVFAAPSEAPSGYVSCWNGKKWIFVQDHRGTVVWKDYQHSAVIKAIGPIPEGWSVQRPKKELTLQDLIQMSYKHKCSVAYGGLLVTKGQNTYKFQTTQDSISMCNAMLALLNSQQAPETVSWKVWKDDTPQMLTLTAQQFKLLFSKGMIMINTAFAVQDTVNKTYSQYTEEQIKNLVQEEQELKLTLIFSQIDISVTLEE